MTPSFYFVTCNSYLGMLTVRLLHQVQHDSNGFVFQQDVAPCVFHMAVRNYLTSTIPGVGNILYEPVTSCRANGRRDGQPLTPSDVLWSYSCMRAKCLAQPQRRSSPLRLGLRITASWLHCAQSLEGTGLRYRLLPCDMHSAHPVSVRYVRKC